MSHTDASERPTRPDPQILSAALERASQLDPRLGSEEAVRWQVGPRVDRPRSTLFPLRAVSRANPAEAISGWRAIYKVIHSPWMRDPSFMPHWEATTRVGLTRSIDLTDRLTEFGRREGIRPARILAADPEALTIVTERISGRPVTRELGPAVNPFVRPRTAALVERIGRAIRLIEEVSRNEVIASAPGMSPEGVEDQLQESRRLGLLSEQDVGALRARMLTLLDETTKVAGGLVHAHGDVSSTNVLAMPDGIGLIDLSWRVQPRGYDLAKFSVRLESLAVLAGRRSATVDALMAGYGDHSVREHPGWRLVHLQQSLRAAMRLSRSSGLRRVTKQPLLRRFMADVREQIEASLDARTDGPADREVLDRSSGE